ncbi:uncharacterized protein LOC119606905 isoform X1 [Lucilia sericata]|uniref:uncharacterized protein LOC119606905 isoform X1 n=1 Tax=Lucilia sericata TaxID=13632 RepID=UPI0018A85B6F|nr:uncharacterized protein LOC119606905 isoform X1 [Lucilia sericata]
MDNTNSVLLPHILESLSQKPELCDTYENLCEEIGYVLSSHNLKQQYGNVENALESALDVGRNLGIITLTDDLIRVPFNLSKSAKGAAAGKKKSAVKPILSPTDESENFIMQPRRTHTVRPAMIPHGRRSRRISRSRRRRRSGRRRSRSRRR